MKDFNSMEELYQYVLPALKIRARELTKEGKTMSESFIWESLIKCKWEKSKDLSLAEIINDILWFQK